MEANVIGDDQRYRGRSGAWPSLQFDRIQYLTCLIVQQCVEMGYQQLILWIFRTCRDLKWMRDKVEEAIRRSPRMNASES